MPLTPITLVAIGRHAAGLARLGEAHRRLVVCGALVTVNEKLSLVVLNAKEPSVGMATMDKEAMLLVTAPKLLVMMTEYLPTKLLLTLPKARVELVAPA